MPTAEEFDEIVRLAVYRKFVGEGAPPTPLDLAAHLGAPPLDVEASYRRLAERRVLVLAPGTSYIWMANPLSAIPTSFSVSVGDRSWSAPCIWDALGAVAMLGGDGRVDARCPDCAKPLEVVVSGNELAAGEGIVHYSVPARHWWDDIGFS